MLKIALRLAASFAICLTLSKAAAAAPEPAEHCVAMVPFGAPTSSVATTPLCRKGYLAAYSPAVRLPLWVAEHLTPASAWGCGERIDAFKPDPDLPKGGRAELLDYAHSGYDIGHMASAANHLGNPDEQRETFYLSNMVPQLHPLNAGLWFKIEVASRVWASQRGEVLVLSGPVLQEDQPHIGPSRIPVPAAFFKVLIDPVTRDRLGFLVPHLALGWRENLAAYVVPVERIEAATGLRFPNPSGSIRPDATSPWPVDLALADNFRSTACPK